MMKTKLILGFPAYRLREDGVLETRWQWGTYYSGIIKPDKWRRLPLRPNNDGYIPVCLCDTGRKRRRTHLHRLMAEVFISPPPFEKACVRHLDGNPLNNSIVNLAWGTYRDNENDKIQNGTWNTRNGGAKITPLQVKEIRKKLKTISQKIIAVEYGVSRQTITRIANNKIWKGR